MQGIIYFGQGDSGRALVEFNRSLRLNPDSASVYFSIARVHLAQGREDRAREPLENALRRSPSFVAARVTLADVEFRTGHPFEALSQIEKAIEQKPSNLEPYILRAEALAAKGSLRASEERAQRASQTGEGAEPTGSKSYQRLGAVKLHQKNYPKAIEYSQAALKLRPTSSASLYLLGMAYVRLSRPDPGRCRPWSRTCKETHGRRGTAYSASWRGRWERNK